ncbi:hypothetical protein ACFQI7_05815 [Paenibacillus allorhizosphaerae]|uniref:Uncharacterized protein n=1 Tax=Paenibacillus allorhizosphaerae TaxID=2849866 RepID=A0ABN7TCJ5_9BACL|nr:hypothetical protein [Paenibacillus allorhizosphaerae]CAG7620379.1 hypothetical protein PAECIP111802_00663 [Paenibacillus allorhizosphaerae]
MNLQDALFNWLQIRIVAEARPDDQAAQETKQFFEDILREDHKLDEFSVTSDETMYRIKYGSGEQRKLQMFDRESAEQLLSDINSNPKYNE